MKIHMNFKQFEFLEIGNHNMNLTLDGPLIPSSNHIIGKYTTSS